MTWTKDLTTPYHQQDTDYYCGAAVAQMILDSIGAGILDQNTLYNMNHSHSSAGWYTSPDGLNYTLNQLKPTPPTFNSFFVISRADTEPDGSQEIARTLYYYGVATATLVEACGHWIAVRGVQTDVEPAPGNNYSIQGFWVNNPWPPTPSFYNGSLAPPPPHSDPDACGGGGNRGLANEYAAYAGFWRSTYFTGCDVYGVGHPQFISVVDPRRPALGEFRLTAAERYGNGQRFISPERASELALEALKMHNLEESKHFSTHLREISFGKPILVQRLDLPDTFYFLLPLERGGGSLAIASVDGLYGTFNGVHALPGQTKFTIIPREEVLKRTVNLEVEIGDRGGKIRIREGAFCFYPLMVWRPCWESRSPYYPFYQITVGGRHLYIGYDGTIYPTLHDLGKG